MEKNIIEVNSLFKSYPTKDVLKGISFTIKAGEIIGYLGSNGVGKTTTVKIMCGIESDYTGDVTIRGFDLRTQTNEVKKIIGYVPENAVLYEQLTPTEYLNLVGKLYNLDDSIIYDRTNYYLELFQMKKEKDFRMFNFSKGMKQKIHIISSLLHDPEILFLDEPLNGLDANGVILVKEMISRMAAEGKTIFYCSHLMDVVEKVSSRILLLNNGNIIADDRVDNLKRQFNLSSLEEVFTTLTTITND